jgi:phage baseplate assembly protein W
VTSLTGMNRATGAPLSGDDHLAQSCEDIISTPLGTRTMRRDYGCILADLVDRPLNRATTLLASMGIALALAKWEPRIVVRQVTISGELASGQAVAEITGTKAGALANSLTRLTIPSPGLPSLRPPDQEPAMHGIKTTFSTQGSRAIASQSTAVIGIVGTAPDAPPMPSRSMAAC